MVDEEHNRKCLLSPGFRSVAAMAGWDEQTLLMASNDNDNDNDTPPDRNSKPKRRPDPLFKSPPSFSRRKRRDQRPSSVSKFVVALEETLDKKKEQKVDADVNGKKLVKTNESSSGNALISCIDRLREELSCAICLDICFEPSTTPCGHSFCKKCLKSAADKCGQRCPKCRQLISNGSSCTINTVLWNTIQLLFPEEIDARKVVTRGSKMVESGSVIQDLRNQSFRPASVVLLNSREFHGDTALALRLQREELMGRSIADRNGNGAVYGQLFKNPSQNLHIDYVAAATTSGGCAVSVLVVAMAGGGGDTRWCGGSDARWCGGAWIAAVQVIASPLVLDLVDLKLF
ncbi:uncharacterized protein LOC143571764 [Bidens hawaiensis]|uniref:uncharacterized protein LOC143571764 n=1 Tax=Bidens hawaiensis TaxID=980011 RepID=UPI00404A40CD